jgi:hypothetical protein
MVTYASVNASWPNDVKVPTQQEAISGAKRLVRYAYKIAREDGSTLRYQSQPFELTSGRRYTWPRRGVWKVNPDGYYTGGWKDMTHDISHWAMRKFWNGAFAARCSSRMDRETVGRLCGEKLH